MKYCRICLSSYRTTIEQFINMGTPFRAIAKDYCVLHKCNLHQFEQTVAVHKKHCERLKRFNETRENKRGIIQKYRQKMQEETASLDDVEKMVVEIGLQNLMANPDKIGARDIINVFKARQEYEELHKKENMMIQSFSPYFN